MRREDVIGSILRRPESITTATTRRTTEDLQRGVGRRLLLVGDIGVPEEGWSEHGTNVLGRLIAVDDVDILKTLLARSGGGGVPVDGTEIGTELALSIDVKVLLVAEEDDTSGSNQPGEVVLLGIVDLGEIDTVDFGTDLGVVVEDIGGINEEIAKVLITLQTLVRVRERTDLRVFDVGESWSKIIVVILLMSLNDSTTRSVVELVARGADRKFLGHWQRGGDMGSVNLEGWCHGGRR